MEKPCCPWGVAWEDFCVKTSGFCVKSRLRRNEIYWFLDGCSEARRGKGGCMQDWKTTPGIWPPNEPTRRLGSEWGSWALRCTKETSLPRVILMIAPQIKSSDGNFNEMLLRLDFTRKTLSLSKKFMWLFLNVLFLHFAVEINHSYKQFLGSHGHRPGSSRWWATNSATDCCGWRSVWKHVRSSRVLQNLQKWWKPPRKQLNKHI